MKKLRLRARAEVSEGDSSAVRKGGFTIMLDCRWLGHGGAGRVTELLLRELADRPPSFGQWVLWANPAAVEGLVFNGAIVKAWRGHPGRLSGQAGLFTVPRADLRIYMHQIRPLLPGPSITLVYDTIPLHFESRLVTRLAKLVYLKLVCRLSQLIVTVSPQSKDAITRELGVNGSQVIVANLSVDSGRIARIRAIRAASDRSDTLIFVGRFAIHKNLKRLCRAFGATQFNARGGRLLLVGGSPEEVQQMTSWMSEQDIVRVEIRGFTSEEELDQLLATSRALVQPSLEEGYGLPAIEAAAVGLPVAASRTGYMSEIPESLVTFMDPQDERSIAAAIDAAVERSDPGVEFQPTSTLRESFADAVAIIAGQSLANQRDRQR